MSTSGDRDMTIEVALSLGRKVEVFPADKDNIEAVKARVRESFGDAWNDGLFKVWQTSRTFKTFGVIISACSVVLG